MASDLDTLNNRTDVKELFTDAGFAGAEAAGACKNHRVGQKVSAIKGRKSRKPGLEQFRTAEDEKGEPVSITCPHSIDGEIRKMSKSGRYTAGFDSKVCEGCPFSDQCPARPLKKKNLRVLRFTSDNIRVAAQRQQVSRSGKEVLNKRASIESTVRSVIHPFGGHLCKLPVRGKARITSLMVLSAAMVNIRRITGYLCPDNLSTAPVTGCMT